MILRTLTLTGALAWLPAAAQVYQCPGPDGQKRFQQAPCDGHGAGALAVKPVPQMGGTMMGDRPAGQQSQLERDFDMRRAIEARRIVLGMTESQAIEAWGPPARVNTDAYASGVKRQMIYQDARGTRYVYTDNGIVTAVQDRPAIVTRRERSCPSPGEIANKATQLNSITLREPERRELQRELDRMRACR